LVEYKKDLKHKSQAAFHTFDQLGSGKLKAVFRSLGKHESTRTFNMKTHEMEEGL